MPHLSLCLLTAALWLANPATAAASTLPRVDLEGGRLSFAAGLAPTWADLCVDYGLNSRLSFGFSLMQGFLPNIPGGLSPYVTAARLTWNMGTQPWGLAYGATLSAVRLHKNTGNPAPGAPEFSYYAQPALNVTWAPGGFGGPWAVRATLGPMIGRDLTATALIPWPNLEVSYRLSPVNELTLGGNSLIGWRGTI